MRAIRTIGEGVVCLAALTIMLAGCSQVVDEKNPLDASTLDPFTQAVIYAKNGNVAKLEAGIAADPGIVQDADESGMTLLHFAAASGKADTVKLLLDNGADVNVADDGGETPLDYAEEVDADEAVLELLRSAGG